MRATTKTRALAVLLQLVLVLLATAEANYRQKRIVGGTTAKPPPVDDPVVFVAKDDTEARVYGTRDPATGYYLFRGIRYAEPPIGNRRFQRSVPRYLDGDVNATEWAPPCPQPDDNGGVIGDEDCLHLNVFTPALPDATDGYPVLIWIHGGGYRRGAATQYEMRQLVEKKTIVVSIQYRLGSLGFLSSADKDLPGNNGLFDMISATEWVREYIEFFGGNPKKITAFGQGTGASSAFLLGLSKFGNTYYSGIIAMSGSVLSKFAVDEEPMNSTKSMAESYNCPLNDTVMMVRCLRELPAAKIIEHDNQQETTNKAKNFITDLSSLLNPGPVVEGQNDGRSLPNFVLREPANALSMDDVPEIPLLTGVVKDETGGAVYGPFKDTITETLNAIPNFLVKNLIPELQKIVPAIGAITKQFVPDAFSKYLTFNPFEGPGRSSGNRNNNRNNAAAKSVDTLAKVGEVLNDAIFNVPAFLTVKTWAKKSKAYLYSFDHNSKQGFGKDFLSGLPLVGNSAETGKTSHGDDLGYIFEPNTITGEAMPQKSSFTEEDKQVREVFTDLIANFARSGSVGSGTKSNGGGGGNGGSSPFNLPSFSGNGDDDGYLSISAKPKVAKGFRFCEMGLWAGIAERFKASACSAFQVDIASQLKTIEKTLTGVTGVSDLLNVDGLTNLPAIPSVPTPVDLPKVEGILSKNPLASLGGRRPASRPPYPRSPPNSRTTSARTPPAANPTLPIPKITNLFG